MIYYVILLDQYGYEDAGYFCNRCLVKRVSKGYTIVSKIASDNDAIECEDCMEWLIESYVEFYDPEGINDFKNPHIKTLYQNEIESGQNKPIKFIY